MSKREQLMEHITQDIIVFLIKDRELDVAEAINLFYNSIVFEKFHNEDTGLYLEGSLYIYDLLKMNLPTAFCFRKKYRAST